jgi:hypothetical protein
MVRDRAAPIQRAFSLAGLAIILIGCGSSSDGDHVPSDSARAIIRTAAERRLRDECRFTIQWNLGRILITRSAEARGICFPPERFCV